MPKIDRGLSPKGTEFIQSLVIYKDEHVIAINKPVSTSNDRNNGVA